MPDRPRLRIALLGETGGPGGAERIMLQLAVELRARGHEIIPIGPARRNPWLRAQFRERGFDTRTFTLRAPLDPLCLAEIGSLIRRARVDLVHTHEFFTSVYGGAAAWALRKPHVITMHGGRYYAGRRYRRAALRWSVRRSRGLVAVSAATATDLTRTLGLSASAVRVIHNGIRHEPGDATKLRGELGMAAGELLIVAVGNLYPVKGHAVLLRALAQLEQDAALPRWRLAIAGRGAAEAALREFVAAQGWEGRVHLLGFRDDVSDLLAAADVFALPSLSEGLPLALAEAMWGGKAIVASRTGGIPEVVTHGGEGFLAPPGDERALAACLRELLTQPDLRQRLGEAARRGATERLSVERMVDEYERLYAAATQRM
ncbi:MAG: glycosyltransferase family 4 protein [Gemmatimonadaceae bacterium]